MICIEARKRLILIHLHSRGRQSLGLGFPTTVFFVRFVHAQQRFLTHHGGSVWNSKTLSKKRSILWHECAWRTNNIGKGFRFVLPRDCNEIDGNARQRDHDAHEALERTAEERHDDEEDGDEDEEDWKEEIHLKHNKMASMYRTILQITSLWRQHTLMGRLSSGRE